MHDMLWHTRIDLAGQLDEARVLTKFTRFPSEIKRIDRNAMPAKPGAGIKRHESERFCLGGVNDLPNIDSHRVVNDFQLINERDVHASKNVLQQFGSLGRAAR